MSMRHNVTPGTRLHTDRNREYMGGYASASKDLDNCVTDDDAKWYQKVVWDNLFESRPHFVAGYVDRFCRDGA